MSIKFLPGGNSRCSGYILLEVTLAVLIFACVVVGLAITLNAAIEAGLRQRRETAMVWALESKLAEARLTRLVIGKETSGRDENGVVYEKEISPLDVRTKQNQFMNGLYNIKITAYWKEDGRAEERNAQTYVYQP